MRYGHKVYWKRHPLYQRWWQMKQRCYNPRNNGYINYGGRGIGICKEWRDNFHAYKEWLLAQGWEEGSSLTVDRIDNDGDYSPENCRLADYKTQVSNKRPRRKNRERDYVGVCQHANGSYFWSLYHDGEKHEKHGYPVAELALRDKNLYIAINNLPNKVQEPKKAIPEELWGYPYKIKF